MEGRWLAYWGPAVILVIGCFRLSIENVVHCDPRVVVHELGLRFRTWLCGGNGFRCCGESIITQRPNCLKWPCDHKITQMGLQPFPTGRISTTRKEPRLQATPQALARIRPNLGPEQIKVFVDKAEAGRKTRNLARTFPQV